MSVAKFTKGTWEVSQYGYEKFSINGIDGVEICGAWNKFNANLIAAAPEMYELLEMLVNPDNCKKDIIHIIGNAESLLAKARGEA